MRKVQTGVSFGKQQEKIMKTEVWNGKKCVVVGAGEIAPAFKREMIKCGSTVIAVDGGLAACLETEILPDYIIGDFDSVGKREENLIEQWKQNYPHKIIQLSPQKDDTDMLAALKWGMQLGYRDFEIWGGTGGRPEHTIANIQSLLYLKKRGCKGCMRAEHSIIRVLKNETMIFPKESCGYLSLFSLRAEAKGVSISHMKYPLNDYMMTNDFPIGVSNEFIGEEAQISVREGEILVIQTEN